MTLTTGTTAILAADHITKSFSTPEGGTLSVLDDISFELRDGEIDTGANRGAAR